MRFLRQPAVAARTRATAGAVTMAGAVITAAVLAFTAVDTTAWSPALTVPVLDRGPDRAGHGRGPGGRPRAGPRPGGDPGRAAGGRRGSRAAHLARRGPGGQPAAGPAADHRHRGDRRGRPVPSRPAKGRPAAGGGRGRPGQPGSGLRGRGRRPGQLLLQPGGADGRRPAPGLAGPAPGRAAAPAWAQLRVRAAAPWPAAASACTVQVTARYGPRWTTVGQAFANVRGAQVQFSYGRGQLTELGVASSAYGRRGTYIPAGTLTVAATAAQRFPARAGPVRALYQTRFRFATAGADLHAAGGRAGAGAPVPGRGDRLRRRGQDRGHAQAAARAVLRAVLRGVRVHAVRHHGGDLGRRGEDPAGPGVAQRADRVRAQRVGHRSGSPAPCSCAGPPGCPAAIPANWSPGQPADRPGPGTPRPDRKIVLCLTNR